MDEIIGPKVFEYTGGEFDGIEQGGDTTTQTLACVMIKSLSNKYEDTIAMVPLTKLDCKIMRRLLLSCKSNSGNRKFYTQELCNSTFDMDIVNPCNSEKKLFCYLIQSIYNNLLGRKFLKCPSFYGEEIIAEFIHLKKFEFHLEETKPRPVKYAHKLNDKVLNHNPIEKKK
nr:uncharacterized protein LOC121115154 [Lepeophtheirus salmonis]